jgi:hypothetical protein
MSQPVRIPPPLSPLASAAFLCTGAAFLISTCCCHPFVGAVSSGSSRPGGPRDPSLFILYVFRVIFYLGLAIALLDAPGRRKRQRARARKEVLAAAPGDEQTLLEDNPELPDCILLPLLFGLGSLTFAIPLFGVAAIISGLAAPARTRRDRVTGALLGLAVGLIDLALIAWALWVWGMFR